MSLKMIEKARRLIKSGRVEHIGMDRYNVIGDHGTYTVALSPDETVTCTCPGYLSKGKCSHSAAVLILTKIWKSR